MEIHYAIDELLGQMPEWKASDLHLTAGSPPAVRINGRLERVENLAPLPGVALSRQRVLPVGPKSSPGQPSAALTAAIGLAIAD
jgi:hypothetical protein